jgi:hypothetical protein
MKSLKSQRGAIDIILILVVFVLAAGVGGYVYYRQQQNNKAEQAAGNGVTVAKHLKKPAPAPDPTANWTAYSSTKGKFSLKYPSTWVQPTNQNLCNPGLFDRSLYLGPTAGTVLHCASEYFGMVNVASTDGDHRADFKLDANSYGNIVTSAVTLNGVTGQKETGTLTKVPDGPSPLKVGTKEINYVFFTNNITYSATYSQGPTDPDVSADFDTMITKTLKFQ